MFIKSRPTLRVPAVNSGSNLISMAFDPVSIKGQHTSFITLKLTALFLFEIFELKPKNSVALIYKFNR